MTLGGLAVAVGRVVDDAIVVLENIYRHRALGEDRLTASINGPREVAGAITAATVTTVGVFLPLGFVGGFVSQFFLPFALTVTFALLASLVCALTVVPVLAYLLINNVKLERRRGRRAQATRSGSAPTRQRSSSRCAAAGRSSGWSACPSLLFFGTGAHRAAAADPVHQRGLREDPRGHRRAAGRHVVRGGPRPGDRGRDHPAHRPQGGARPDQHPGRGRGRLPDDHRRPSGRPANSARMTVRLERRRRPHGLHQAPGRRARADPDRRLRRRRHPGGRVHLEHPSTSSSRARTRRRSSRSTTRSSRPSPTTPSSSTSSPTCRAGTPEIRVTPDPNKAILDGLTTAQVAQEVRAPSSAPPQHTVQLPE